MGALALAWTLADCPFLSKDDDADRTEFCYIIP